MQKPIDTVVVIRDGCQKELLISNVVVGDVVCLTSGSPIPGDGLVIVNPGDDHSLLVVDHDGLESTVDEKTPFLFYGAKVINGNGQMLITSVGLDTVLGELMNQVSNTCNETPLPAQLEKVGTTTQIAGISISILTLVVLFLRFMLEGKHTTNQHSADLPELKNTAATKGIIDIIKKVATKPDGKICRFTTLLAILLVGIQEPIPFVILLATAYMRKRMFSGKAYAEDLLAYVTVGSANIICAEKLYQPEVVKCYVGGENIQKGCWADSGVGTCVVEVLCQCISTPILMALVHGRSTEDPLLPWAASELGMDMEISRQNSTVQEMKALSSNEEGRKLISFITTVSLVAIPITAIQLILANFVVNLAGGLALLTEPPTDELMLKSPISPTEPFITKGMWRNIATQALYQTSILVTLHFKGKNLLGISEQVSKSIVFNSFMVCQAFNLLNSREPEKKNVLKGLAQNPCFHMAVFIILILKVSFTEISHILVDYARLNMRQWGLCILMGFVSLPIDLAVKLTASFIKIYPLLPNIGSTSFTASVPAESTASSIFELPWIAAGKNSDSTTLA
ncbi:hypothetical protein FEM48_Zijuj01G0084500 [Ziziphus jujuba var. spinosa]|uniref:Calcium-transporting ATPase 13, plasma membrane-type n=1 Tax=Ziziphus jujuba var. spinosa TaxID=714518 RepID=A0A978W068_ZIZJJ|nr:hypothetical protein FEM48_Zijuj01G0084500 [Ziziphus jujuba var. spinosa]